jgi:adenylyltransferase/sulfurtransferase
MSLQRYHRQMILPQIGEAGQRRLASARVLLVGCGALGSTIADQLARAGVGHLTLADRDVVELTNLQRQTLYDERDAAEQTPKAVAAANRLRAVNSSIQITPLVTDVHSGNVEALLETDLILDGTDNVQTRYLINDAAVKHGLPWVYGGAVGMDGRVMAVVPGVTPCLRCVFREPPTASELPTCDTAGVLGPAAAIVAAYQAIESIKILIGERPRGSLLTLDFWTSRSRVVSLSEKDPKCPCCGEGKYDFLNALSGDAVTLCGRNSVQVRPAGKVGLNLDRLAERLAKSGDVQRSPYFVKCHLSDPAGVVLTVFPDNRALVQGVADLARARSIYARFVGA